MDEKTPIVGTGHSPATHESAIYYGAGQSPAQRNAQIVTAIVTGLASLACFAVCIYRGVVKQSAGSHFTFLYFMFGITQLGLTAIQIIMVVFIKKGIITEGKMWFTYLSAAIIIMQSIFTDILVFHK